MIALIGLVVLIALMIPIVAIVIDSPVGRALARRLEGPNQSPPEIATLAKRVDLLESDVDELTRVVGALREENQFLQRLAEDASNRRQLPPHPPS